MREPVTFASKVALEHRHDARAAAVLQSAARTAWRAASWTSSTATGRRRSSADGEWLRVRVAGLPDVQSLFAVEATTGRPIGVAVYMRADLEHVTVLHLGLSEEYCAGGEREGSTCCCGS